ncbi:MAG: PQQ-binding-like beta-propeller repeat protein [Gemmataceae bacterium]
MSRYLGVLALVTMLAASFAVFSGEEPAKDAKDKGNDKGKAEPKDIDIVKDARDWNSDKFVGPPTQFRQGHVTPHPLDDKVLQKTDAGFVISLPSNAPIPTPTVYDGKLYLSGGFHSKQFFCMDAATGKFVWGMNLDDDGPSAAVVEDGVCVFNTESCTIFALDAKTGKHLWSYWLGDPLTSTPTIANGVVFTSYPAGGGAALQMEQNVPQNNLQKDLVPQQKSAPDEPKPVQQVPQVKQLPQPAKNANGKGAPPCSHVLAAFDLKSGKILWQRWIDSDVMSAPVAVDKELYVTSFAGVVYRFKQKDGEIVSARKSRATSAPVVVGKEVYLTKRTDDGKGPAREAIAAQERDSERQVYQTKDKIAAHIDRQVQADSKLNELGKNLDAGNGFGGGAPATANAQAAKQNIGQASVSTMQAWQGARILNYRDRNINCMGDEVVCVDPKTGKNLWSFKLEGDLKKEGGMLAAPPAAAGGMLFLATLNGQILQMDPKEGKVVKSYKVGHQSRFQPVIVDGKIYVGTQNGKVVCVDTGDKQFTGWNCWGANAAHTGLLKDK